MKKVIEGTEDDIRKEVQAVSGFATDSQVMALAGARNKQLIKNYNNLLAQKEMAMQTVQTMIGLSAQDRQMALQNILQKFNIEGQIQSYRDKFINNAKEGYNRIIEAVGYQGLYQMLSQDPSALALAEKTLGLGAGQLAEIAQQAQLQEQQPEGANELAQGYPFYKYPGSPQVFDAKTNEPLSFEEYKKRGGIGEMGSSFGDVFEVGGVSSSGELDKLLTPTEAARLGVPYGTTRGEAAELGTTPQFGTSGGGGGGTTTYKFTSTQLNKGAANAGLSLTDFQNLDGDVQNYYVNLSPTNAQNLKDTIANVQSGAQSAEEVIEYIKSKSVAPAVEAYLIGLVQFVASQTTAQTKQPGVITQTFQDITQTYNNIWSGIKSLFQ